MRVTVGRVVSQIGAGCSVDEVLADYPTSNAKMSCKRCAVQPVVRRNTKSKSPPAHEDAGGHELVATLSDALAEWAVWPALDMAHVGQRSPALVTSDKCQVRLGG